MGVDMQYQNALSDTSLVITFSQESERHSAPSKTSKLDARAYEDLFVSWVIISERLSLVQQAKEIPQTIVPSLQMH
jgi:hypothetical protein